MRTALVALVAAILGILTLHFVNKWDPRTEAAVLVGNTCGLRPVVVWFLSNGKMEHAPVANLGTPEYDAVIERAKKLGKENTLVLLVPCPKLPPLSVQQVTP